MGTEALICICERIPALLKSNKDYLTKLLEMIFFHMIDLDEEIDDTWMTPIEGFNEDIEDDADFEKTRFGMNAIDRLTTSLGDKEMLP